MHLLFDQGAPVPLRRWLAAHEVATAWQRGWAQNLSVRRLAILVLTVANWPALEPHASGIAAAITSMQPGEYREWSSAP